ncbi:MAG: YihY/virulence factor BrkB family protein [Acidimicrobiales bacterium]
MRGPDPETAPVNPIEKVVRTVDHAQQHQPVLGFLFGVNKKYGDDRAGQLAALLTYYGFLTVFPLLLLFVTIIGIVAGSDPHLAHRIEHSVFSEFPVIGSGSGKNSLANNIHALHRNSVIGLVIGILGLVWGSQGASETGQFAMAQVWNIPGVHRPNYWTRLARASLFMVVLGLFAIVSFGLSGIAGWGDHSIGIRIGGIVGSLVVNGLSYLIGFRVLTPKQIGTRQLVPGAMVGAVFWTVLQNVGTELVEHQLRGSSQVYGSFALVLGLIAWMYLTLNLTMYAAEANVVLARRLWPRSMMQPPLTRADEEVLSAIAKQEERRPEQTVHVAFDRAEPAPSDPVPEEASSDPASDEAPIA